MDAQRHRGVVRGGQHRVPVVVLVVQRRQSELRGVLGEGDRLGAHRCRAFDLLRGELRVPQRDDDERDESPGGESAPLFDHPVVVRTKALEAELTVLRFHKGLAAVAREHREAQRREDAVFVHVGDAGDGVVETGAHLLVRRETRRDLVPRCAGLHQE